MTLNGLTSIRAYDQLAYFSDQFKNENELSANVTFTYAIINRWLGFRLDFGIIALTLFATGFCIVFKGRIDNELLAFSLQTLTDFQIFFSISIRMMAEMQNYVTSAQSIEKYTKLEIEDRLEKPNDKILIGQTDSKRT